jgi:hypothetical protein
MAFLVRYAIEVEFIVDGAGAMGTYPVSQKLKLGTLDFKDLTTRYQVPTTGSGIAQPVGYQGVPGGNVPSQANFRTAFYGSTAAPTGGMLLDLDTAIGLNLARIQGFATGGG